jgi:hypothetical protein
MDNKNSQKAVTFIYIICKINREGLYHHQFNVERGGEEEITAWYFPGNKK